MIEAKSTDKALVIDILTRSFTDNKSVNYLVKHDGKRSERIKYLMDYSFDICSLFGNVYLSDDKQGCALVLKTDKKRFTLKSIMLDLKLINKCIGWRNVRKALNRESQIKKLQIQEPSNYLWFIGVQPVAQNKGVGSSLLRDIIRLAEEQKRPITLETSTLKNIPWYRKFGFQVYQELELGYCLYFLVRN